MMSASWISWLSRFSPSAREVRSEVWRLGVLHHGEPLAGARQELAGDAVAPARAALLRACIRAMKRR